MWCTPPPAGSIISIHQLSRSVSLFEVLFFHLLKVTEHIYREMELTALFTACRCRHFLARLSTRGRNYEFDFLRPTHSLPGYFNRLADQYTKVLQPSKEMLDQEAERNLPLSELLNDSLRCLRGN